MTDVKRIVVFDLDQTLGCFTEIGMFWSALNKILNYRSKEHFFKVMDMFQEFLRPKIITIIKSVLIKKAQGKCDKIMIYTNNNGPRTWVQMIADYFEYKLGEKVFDVISAFKFNNNIIEICRTSESKNTPDLLRCANVAPETKICFFDDLYHPLMKDDNVYYVNIKPFYYSIPYKTMAERYNKLYVDSAKYPHFVEQVVSHMKKYTYTVITKSASEIAVDEVVSKQMVIHLNKFFGKHSKTSTRRKYHSKKTRKR